MLVVGEEAPDRFRLPSGQFLVSDPSESGYGVESLRKDLGIQQAGQGYRYLLYGNDILDSGATHACNGLDCPSGDVGCQQYAGDSAQGFSVGVWPSGRTSRAAPARPPPLRRLPERVHQVAAGLLGSVVTAILVGFP